MIKKSAFESGISESDVYKIGRITNLDHLKKDLAKCRSHIITKIDTENIPAINLLLGNAFSYSGVTLYLECLIEDKYKEKGFNIIELTLAHKDKLFQICDESFASNNRYANDAFLKRFNKEIHRNWIVNSIGGYADYCCGFVSDNRLAGFGTLHISKEHASIGLLAVGRRFRKQGIGLSIVNHLKIVSLEKGRKRIAVATEAGNDPALNLYMKADFSFNKSEISLYRMAIHKNRI